MSYTFDENIVSDLHKDARGFRPSQYWWDQWELCSDDQKQFMWDSLIEELNESIEREKRMEQEAIKEFESLINLNIALGSLDRKGALHWMTQTEEFYNEQCVEHWVWNQGFLFTEYGRKLVDELMDIVIFKEYA